MFRKILLSTVAFAAFTNLVQAQSKIDFINNWLILGSFENDAKNTGFDRAWIDETKVTPAQGQVTGVRKWEYFDDRLFSRNYDDYQDLLSYYKFKRKEPVDARVVYAHTYVFSKEEQKAMLYLGADSEAKVWLNGAPVLTSTIGQWQKDSVKAEVVLQQGWNRLLVKVANVENTRLGFYLGFTNRSGRPLKDISVSVNGPAGNLKVATSGMPAVGKATMPTGWREWPYIAARPDPTLFFPPGSEKDEKKWFLNSFLKPSNPGQDYLQTDDNTLHATAFSLQAQGGTPPYRWTHIKGELPPGLTLASSGQIDGTISSEAALKDYTFTARVTDAKGATAIADLTIPVLERPNKWYEEARLACLVHAPEFLTDSQIEEFVALAKRQGYQVIMPISYNNGDMMFRWPSPYAPKGTRDMVGKFKQEIEKQGLIFGMYIGNLNLEVRPGAPFKNKEQHLMMEEVIRKYQPKAFWFDWPVVPGEALDSLYSMMRTLDPNLVIILNGNTNASNGDWDIIDFEAYGYWANQTWGYFPVEVPWPKKGASESWRRMSYPARVPLAVPNVKDFKTEADWQASRKATITGPLTDPVHGWEKEWKEYFRVHIAMIGEGQIANMDFSLSAWPKAAEMKSLSESPHYPYRVKMADWASPKDMPPLYPSFTQVNPGPLDPAPWGYNMINRNKDVIYLHFQKNPRGKTGLPTDPFVSVGPVTEKVKSVTWMNQNKPLPFTQSNTSTNKLLTIDLAGVTQDDIDTIFKIELEKPITPPSVASAAVPPGNLATNKPSAMYGLDGKTHLIPSSGRFPKYGNDGDPSTVTVGGGSWAWIYEVDLERPHPIKKIAMLSSDRGYATEYEIQLSLDRETWTKVATVQGINVDTRVETVIPPTEARYVRLRALKPDGPGQIGGQMAVAELEVYE